MADVRVGFVGCGTHPVRNLLPLLHEAGLDLAAVCDLDKRKAQRVARQFGAHRCYQDLAGMIEEMDLDGVLVCGPPELHVETALQALARGLPVWTETPPAPTLAEAERVAEMSAAKNVPVLTGLVMRFAPAYALLKQIITGEQFRGPSLLQVTWCTRGAGGLHEMLAHGGLNAADIVRDLMGEIAGLSASRVERAGRASVAVSMRLASGAVGTIVMSNDQPRTREVVEVFGDDCWAAVNGRAEVRWQTRGTGRPGDVMTWAPDLAGGEIADSTGRLLGYLPALEHFAAVARGEQQATGTIHDAVAAMRIAARIESGEGELVQVG